MKILISGASGFIGTNLLEFYRQQGCELLNVDIVPPVHPAHQPYYTHCDILDKDSLISLVQQFNPDYLVHLAARTDLNGGRVEEYPANTTGVKNILEAAGTATHLKRVIITSSMLVCKVGYQPAHELDFCPPNAYGASKVQTEEITRAHGLTKEWLIIRPSSIWGPWFKEPYRNFFDLLRKGFYFHTGHVSATKTYGYVQNSVWQIDRLLKAAAADVQGKVFYIGDTPPIHIGQWADEIYAAMGKGKVPRMPWALVKMLAFAGDLLKAAGLPFPMSSFRLKNMSTDHILNLQPLYEICGAPPFTRKDGIHDTLKWLNEITEKK